MKESSWRFLSYLMGGSVLPVNIISVEKVINDPLAGAPVEELSRRELPGTTACALASGVFPA